MITTEEEGVIDQYQEGSVRQVLVNAFERNPEARKKCIEHYGTSCQVCGMDYETTYGKAYAGIIQVHHIIPLSTIGKSYVCDPIKDLIPLCPNCHVAIHKKHADGSIASVEELRRIMNGCK